MEVNVNGYVVPTSERHDRDLIALAMGALRITKCPGGRYTVRGSLCAHCGSDFSADPTFCGQPVDEDGVTPFDTTVARRIMTDSEANMLGE